MESGNPYEILCFETSLTVQADLELLLSPFLKCWLGVPGTVTVAIAFLITARKPVSSLAVVGSVTISTEVLDEPSLYCCWWGLLLLVSVQHWLITWFITFDLNLDVFRCFKCTKTLFVTGRKSHKMLPSLCIQKGKKPMLPVSRDMLRSQGWGVWFVSV